METTKDIHIYRNPIKPMNQLKHIKIRKGKPDVRGWDILGRDGVKFGKVHDLIVDTKSNKVRYLDVDIKKDILSRKEELQMLVPIGAAILNKDDKNVVFPDLSVDQLYDYPLYKREPIYILRDYERSVRDYFNNGRDRRDHKFSSNFYHEERYNEERFYSGREC